MIKIENKQVFSTEDKFVHRIGTDTYFKRGTVLPADTVDDFEEVDEIPQFTREDYEAEVERLIRERYSVSQELAILRQRDAKPEEFAAYNAFAEQCKASAKVQLTAGEEAAPEE